LLPGRRRRPGPLLRRPGTNHPELPRADSLTARMTEMAGDSSGALMLYLKALEISPGLALEIIPRVLDISRELGQSEMLGELVERLRRTGRVNARQLVWLLATALPPHEVRRLAAIAGESGGGLETASAAASPRAL